MDREIKYRAYDIKLHKMYSWEECLAMFELSDLNKYTATQEDRTVIFMQYLGWEDVNGIEIYEGDVAEISEETLRSSSSNWIDSLESHTGEIVYAEQGGEYWLQFFFPKYKKYTSGINFLNIREEEWHSDSENEILSKQIVVVGNVYENKEYNQASSYAKNK